MYKLQCSAVTIGQWRLVSSAYQVSSVLPQQFQTQLVFPRLQPQGSDARAPSVEVRRRSWARGGRYRAARRRHGCRRGQQGGSVLVVVSDRTRTWHFGALWRRNIGEETLERTSRRCRVVCQVAQTGRKKWGRRPAVVRAREMMWCWVVAEVAPWQHGARR